MGDERANNDTFEPELRSFAPVEPSPALFDAVERGLARDARSLTRWRSLAAGIAVAACLVVALILWRVNDPYVDPAPRPIESVATVPVPDDERPALASYRRVMSRPAADLDRLLDRHAARVLPGRSADGARLTAASDL